MRKLCRLLPKELKQLKFDTQLTFESSTLGVISQSFNWNSQVSFDLHWFFQEYPYFCQFYYRNDKERNRTFTQICGSQWKINRQMSNLAHVEKRYCCFSLKIVYEDFTSVNIYDKTNLNTFVLSLWEKYRCGSCGHFIYEKRTYHIAIMQQRLSRKQNVWRSKEQLWKCWSFNSTATRVKYRHSLWQPDSLHQTRHFFRCFWKGIIVRFLK